MARFLAATWSIPGHYYPNLAVACALRERGHEVAFLSGERAREAIAAEGFDFFPFEPSTDAHVERLFFNAESRPPRWRPRLLEQRARYYDWLVGELRTQVTAAERAVEAWRPDVLMCDPALWGVFLVVPERRGVPTAIFNFLPFCPLPGRGMPPLGWGLPPARTPAARATLALAHALFRAGAAKFRRKANALREEFGLEPLSRSVTEAAGRLPLYIVAGTRELDYPRDDLPPSVHYVGPCPWKRRRASGEATPAWLERLDCDRPAVLVTEGTVHTGRPFVSLAAVRGLGERPMQVVVSTSTRGDSGLGPLPSNVVADHWTNIRYEDLLPRLDVVVSTAGGGTVTAALEAGVPLVCVPTDWDKPEVARRVAEAGAGVTIPPRRCTPRHLRRAVERVLSEASFRKRAEEIAASLRGQDGPRRATELLEGLAAARGEPRRAGSLVSPTGVEGGVERHSGPGRGSGRHFRVRRRMFRNGGRSQAAGRAGLGSGRSSGV